MKIVQLTTAAFWLLIISMTIPKYKNEIPEMDKACIQYLHSYSHERKNESSSI